VAPSSTPSDSESRFSAYVEALGAALGHSDRILPARRYCAGLLLPGDRKSIEPMGVEAARRTFDHANALLRYAAAKGVPMPRDGITTTWPAQELLERAYWSQVRVK
jgi:SRSO17 transposase